DTSVNYLRNSARLRAFQRALIKYYRWDAVGDRLTCPACRSMDGRVFRTEDAVRVLDTIESSEDPTIVKELRPIITTQVRGPSAQILTKWPPLHPHCYDRETDVFTNEGWKKFAELNGTELFLSFNPQNPRELAFVPAVNFISYHYKGKMIRFYNRQLDLCVTPEHQMIIYSRGGKKRLPKGYH
ncbi:MAG: hypothetical protein NZ530_08145, partial [Thermodesulfobacteriaceae bacterium]|nr:hypothetical protein [Thermodesulfobacteriaceae bacterium]